MAVAERMIAEGTPRQPERELALKSLLGALYLIFSLGLVFAALPWIWTEVFPSANPFLSDALLLLVLAGVAVGLIFLGRYLEGHKPLPVGFRTGVIYFCIAAIIVVGITQWIGTALAESELGTFGAGLTLAIGCALAFGAILLLIKPAVADTVRSVDEQGWFQAVSYKPTQGVRVRRGTMLALLVLGVCGVYTMISHKTLGSDRLGIANNWELVIPFTEMRLPGEDVTVSRYVPILYQVHYTLPLLMCLAMIWVAWRIVNWPVFADFLIATEAEVNKVSWTTRARLFQDTIVVLVTVFFLTIFLFAVDILWIKVLSSPVVQVLRVDVRAEQLKQQEKSQW